MTLLSIFCPKLYRESANPAVADDPVNGGFKTKYWFWGAANRLSKSFDKNQVTENVPRGTWSDCVHDVMKKGGDYNAYAVCTSQLGTPTKQAVSRLLGNPMKCECETCKERKAKAPKAPKSPKVPKPKKPRKIHTKKAKPKHQRITVVQADSGSQFPGHLRQAKLAIITNQIREASQAADGYPTKFRVTLIREGLGNFGDAYYYTKEALESAVDIFNGSKIYADHPTMEEEQIRPERSTRDILGHFENLDVETDDGGCAILCGDVDIVPSADTEWARCRMVRAVENAEKFPDKDFIGLSINASGDAEKTDIAQVLKDAPEGAKQKLLDAQSNGTDLVKVVRVINSAVSCDLVTEAGAGGKIQDFIERGKNDGKKENSKTARS